MEFISRLAVNKNEVQNPLFHLLADVSTELDTEGQFGYDTVANKPMYFDDVSAKYFASENYVDTLGANKLGTPTLFDANAATQFPAGNPGDHYEVSVAGTIDGVSLSVGDVFYTGKTPTVGTPADWVIIKGAGNLGVTDASNGLTNDSGNVKLGGTLTEATTITTDGNVFTVSGQDGGSFSNTLSIDGNGQAKMETFFAADNQASFNAGQGTVRMARVDIGGTVQFSTNNSSYIQADSNNSSFEGIRYGDDYSANYTPRSLVDKAYVDAQASGITADNGITNDAGTIKLGGTLTGSTTIDGVTDTNLLIIDGSESTFTSNLTVGGQVIQAVTNTNNADSSQAAFQMIQDTFVIGHSSSLGAKTLTFQAGDTTFTDSISSKGIIYAADYSANFTDRSLVDKAYVDGQLVATSKRTTVSTTTTANTFTTVTHNFDLTNAYEVQVTVWKDDSGTFKLSTAEVEVVDKDTIRIRTSQAETLQVAMVAAA